MKYWEDNHWCYHGRLGTLSILPVHETCQDSLLQGVEGSKLQIHLDIMQRGRFLRLNP